MATRLPYKDGVALIKWVRPRGLPRLPSPEVAFLDFRRTLISPWPRAKTPACMA